MNDQDDDQWLNALAGKSDPSAPKDISAQAQAVRQAMLARRAQIEAETQKLDPTDFQRLQERLEKEGLLTGSSKTKRRLPDWLSKLLPIKDGRVAALPACSLAANVVLGVVVVAQVGLQGAAPPPVDVLRGDQVTTLRVKNPETRLTQLTRGLDAAKARFVVQRKSKGDLILLIQADEAGLDYLIEQRIEPRVEDGLITIRLSTS